jgi:hypothetical protein
LDIRAPSSPVITQSKHGEHRIRFDPCPGC